MAEESFPTGEQLVKRKLPGFFYVTPIERAKFIDETRFFNNELWKILKKYPKKFNTGERIKNLFKNPNVTMRFIEENFPEVLENEKGNIKYWKYIQLNPNFNYDFYIKHKNLRWIENDFLRVFSYEDILKLGKERALDLEYYSKNIMDLIENNNLTDKQVQELTGKYDFVEKYGKRNLDIPDSGRNVLNKNGVATFYYINYMDAKDVEETEKKYGIPMYSSFLTFFDLKNLEDYSNLRQFSSNPNLTVDIIDSNPKVDWDWDAISANVFKFNPIVFYRDIASRHNKKLKEKVSSNMKNITSEKHPEVETIISDYAKFGIRRRGKRKRGKKSKKTKRRQAKVKPSCAL
jgi:hypothetical protein